LNQAVRRNISRFPGDFMFELAPDELDILKSHSVTSSWGGVRKPPLAFTEQGVAMLSSVLRSERAATVNIQIVRAFVRMRNLVVDNADVRKAIKLIESRVDVHDRQIQIAFSALESILKPRALPVKEPKIKIGLGPGDRKPH
jgi:hypothetical protein